MEVSALGIPLKLQNTASPRTRSSHLGEGTARRERCPRSSYILPVQAVSQKDGDGFLGVQALDHPAFPS